jgi:uncharacterized protein YcgI (DUF1989 family)
VQWQAYLGPGSVLLSDMGRALMTFVADTTARHDAFCGSTSATRGRLKYGATGIHTASPTARELLTVGAAKHGLTPRDLAPGLNLFKSAVVDDAGALHLDGAPRPGAAVDLRAEMDLIVMLANVPHPLDERPTYTPSTIRCLAWSGPRAPAVERLRGSTPERQRAYENTDDLLLGSVR